MEHCVLYFYFAVISDSIACQFYRKYILFVIFVQKWWSQASDTIQNFSKVTRYLMDTIGQQGGLEEHRPIRPEIEDHCATQNTSEGFEILNDREVCEKLSVMCLELLRADLPTMPAKILGTIAMVYAIGELQDPPSPPPPP